MMVKLIRKILTYLVWGLTAAGIPLLLGFVRANHYQKPLAHIDIKPLNKHQVDFVSVEEVLNSVSKKEAKGLPLILLNNRKIEKTLRENPYISQAKVYTTLDRVLVIKFMERVPFMQVHDMAGQWHYLDTNGVIFPKHPERAIRLLPAIGSIPVPVKHHTGEIAMATESFENEVYYTINLIGKAITRDAFLNLLIDYIYVDENWQFTLIPTLGRAEIVLGSKDSFDKKLAAVAAFYRMVSTRPEFGKYQRINASFENQIVCTIKRDSI